jgi:hypothetical protein
MAETIVILQSPVPSSSRQCRTRAAIASVHSD